MLTKIHIDINQGLVIAEGDSKFVREVFSCYKDKLLDKDFRTTPSQENSAAEPSSQQKLTSKKRNQKKSTKTSTGDKGSSINPEKPKLDSSLKIEVPHLKEFHNQFDIKNEAEAILVFVKYLIDEFDVEEPNINQILTCFHMVKRKIPKNLAQVLRNTKAKRYGYIDYESLKGGINITPTGYNHFNHELKRKSSTK